MNCIRYFFLLGFTLLAYVSSFGQDSKVLPMDVGADNSQSTVLTKGSLVTEIFGKNKVLYHHNYSIQVNNNNIENDRVIAIPFSKFEKIENLKIEIFDINGKRLKAISKKDMLNQALVDNVTIMSDDRVLFYKALENKTPYFIRAEYTIESKQSFQLLPFSPSYIGKKILDFDYELRNYDLNNHIKFVPSYWGEPSITDEKEFKSYQFKIVFDDVSLIKSKKKTNFNIQPILVNFSMDNVDGSMENWTSFGNWINTLNEGTEIFDAETQAKIFSLVKDANDDQEKTRILYAFLQEQMRYVSIQLGIGGFKPFSAQYVHNNKYGDCKALSNYMRSVLKLVGIKSNYVIIFAGGNIPSLKDDFAMNVFNHAILAVPFAQDTIFLECTSNDVEYGYLGSYTGNRKALLIDKDNSKLVQTTSYDYLQNVISIQTILDPSKKQNVDRKISMKGMGVEYLSYFTTKHWVEDQFKTYLAKHLSIDKVDLALQDRSYTPHEIKYGYSSLTACKKTGSRFFLKLDLEKGIYSINREMDNWNIYPSVSFGYTFENNFIIQVPPSCIVEKSPVGEIYDKGPLVIDLKVEPSDRVLKISYNYKIKEGDYNELDAGTRLEIYTKYSSLALNKQVVLKCTEESKP